MRILAVDDEPLFLEVLTAALGELGHGEVTTAHSGEEALRALDGPDATYDCILLDIRMPGMDGIKLCRKIRARARHRRTPIMMVTVMTDRHFIDEAFAAGATDYLTKPLDRIELKARMSVMARLAAEQSRSALAEYRAASVEGVVEMKFDFETPVVLDGFDRVIEYLALENYLLSLSVKQIYGASAFAISITNAAKIFSVASPQAFMAMLTDVAVTIEEALKTSSALIAYAGSGDFVVVLRSMREPDTMAIQAAIERGLEDFAAIHAADRLPRPRVEVGPAVKSPLFSRMRALQMIERAIAGVHGGPTTLGAPAALQAG